MGSFLLSCGVSNNVLKEGTPIQLVFLSRPVMDGEELVTSDFFQDWRPEKFLISAIQDDYGHVDVNKSERKKMETIMSLLYEKSISGSSWRNHFETNIGNLSKLEKMAFNKLVENFNEFLVILHNEGIFYQSELMDMTCLMKVSHVDSIVIDAIKDSPIYFEGFGISYNGESDYSRNVISNFDNFIDYLVIKNKEKFKKYIKSEFSFDLDNFGSFDAEGDVACLINNNVDIPLEEREINHVIKTFTTKKRDNLFFSYANLMGVCFNPSLYASQDYSNNQGRSYRNLMSNVFAKQKEALFEDTVERNFDIKVSFDGRNIDDNVSFEDYTKDRSALKAQYMKLPDVVVTESTKILTPQADNYSFLNKKVKE